MKADARPSIHLDLDLTGKEAESLSRVLVASNRASELIQDDKDLANSINAELIKGMKLMRGSELVK